MCKEQWDGENSELPIHKQTLAQLDNGHLSMNNILYSSQYADGGQLKRVSEYGYAVFVVSIHLCGLN